ncbi:uncharacterized protein LOC111294734 [Durio zibethinus]|uniref:Uncharacterized protein LOC111294734 n=1 Tax=Durio zibethinus TaxID=66656 RepID=A0A6P5YUG3_DURZI|nr:uncharacterized protein LOC111294734 [Durio zibethinus]
MLSEYDIIYVSQKVIKRSIIVEFFVDRAVDDYEPMKLDFLDEELMAILELEEDKDDEETWQMYFDGVANAIGHGIGAILISPTEHYYPVTARLNFNYTNNVAEYKACFMGLYAALNKKNEILKMFGDSTLVIYQLKGEWEIRDSKLIPYHKYILKLCKRFKIIRFEHLPWEENQIVDALAILATMVQIGDITEIQPIKLDIKNMPVHYANLEEEEDDRPWCTVVYVEHMQMDT